MHKALCTPTVLVEPAEEDVHPLSSSPECELPPSSLAAVVVRSRAPLVHTVSIVIEPVVEDSMGESESDDQEDDLPPRNPSPHNELLEDDLEPKQDLVKNVMDAARLRKEEFARLLEEHAQIVNEINRAENSLIL